MTTAFFPNLAAGATFGAALAASGVFAPSVIMSHFALDNFHMLKVFVGASATSGLVISLCNKSGVLHCSPRSPSSLGLFNKYDGNIIGGIMIACGMILAGACPGTVYSQIGMGVRSGWFALAGGVVGGMLYTTVSPYLRRNRTEVPKDPNPKLAVYSKLNINPNIALLSFEIMCAVIICLAATLGPKGERTPLSPIYGGMLVGASQLTSILISGNTLGTSASFEQAGKYCMRAWNSVFAPSKLANQPRPPTRAMTYVLGMAIGAWAVGRAFPETAAVLAHDAPVIPDASAFVGGIIMAFGSRIAGGCTSGHGITGMSMLSISSFVTIASLFGCGACYALLPRLIKI